MKNALSLTLAALTLSLAGCGAPAYLMDDPYLVSATAGMGPYTGMAADRPSRGSHDSAPDASQSPRTERPLNADKGVARLSASTGNMVILEGRTQKLGADVFYTDGTHDASVLMTSSDPTIATVNATTGEVSGVRPGLATIQVRAQNDPARAINVQVTVRQGVVQDVLSQVTPGSASLLPGDTLQLKAAIVNSSSQAHPNGTWSSSNQQVAFVNDLGLVTARKPGRATIAFRSDQNATVTASATIVVADPDAPAPAPTPTAAPGQELTVN
jgi:hypothetical protein